MTRTYTDPSFYTATLRQNIRQPLSVILGTRAARMKERQPSEPHVRGHETRRAVARANDPLLRCGDGGSGC